MKEEKWKLNQSDIHCNKEERLGKGQTSRVFKGYAPKVNY